MSCRKQLIDDSAKKKIFAANRIFGEIDDVLEKRSLNLFNQLGKITSDFKTPKKFH